MVSTASVSTTPSGQSTLIFGHPTGLFTLFFAEMWERFSYYGMRALLIFYCINGFLHAPEDAAKSIYGAYTALVYMTPFFGGLLADKLLGARICVVLGGVLMAAGHLLMAVSNDWAFFLALALLICGNGFFKPNISAIVGSLYGEKNRKRDAGFTIFYMGINLGAAMSPLLCGYIGTTYGWHYGFGLATIGMLIGLAVFVMPTLITQLIIAAGALAAAIALIAFHPNDTLTIGLHAFIALALVIAGTVACYALSRGGLPADAGMAKNPEKARRSLPLVMLATAVAVPILALFVSAFSLVNDGEQLVLISDATLERISAVDDASPIEASLRQVLATFTEEIAKPAGLVLTVVGILCFGYLLFATFGLPKLSRDRMIVVLVLTFFQMLFWAFFEQAGSTLNLFAESNVDRVNEQRLVGPEDVGQTLQIQPTQEQVGFRNGETPFTVADLNAFREGNEATDNDNLPAEDEVELDPPLSGADVPVSQGPQGSEAPAAEEAGTNRTILWAVDENDVGMGVAQRDDEVPAPTFQSINPITILLLGLVFAAAWSALAARGLEPSPTVKFSAGLVQVGLGFFVLVWGAQYADERGMISMWWLVLCYVIHTTGELCLSPVGLAMISRLTPKELVSTMMGGWFLATAFSQYLAGIISQFTGGHGENGQVASSMERLETYTEVFRNLGIAAVICGLVCLSLSPLLTKWMHLRELEADEAAA